MLPTIEADGVGSRQDMNMVMEVPEFFQNRGEGGCEDVVKVFITSKATYFPSMILPEMPLSAKDLDGEFRSGHSHILTFLSELVGGLRVEGTAFHDQWATRSFIIRTHVRRESKSLATISSKAL